MTSVGWFAADYRRFRPPVPAAITRRVLDTLNGWRRALDVGCGTGQWTFALAEHMDEVVGIDPDSGMLAEATLAASASGSRVRFSCTSAPELDGVDGTFDLVTFCRSFHWLDRYATLRRVHALTTPTSRLAVLGDGSLWTGETEWQISLRELVRSYLGPERRAGRGTYEAPRSSHQDELKRAGFLVLIDERQPFEREWTAEKVLGYMRSTSYARPDLFADHAAFERAAAQMLANQTPLVERGNFHLIVTSQEPGVGVRPEIG